MEKFVSRTETPTNDNNYYKHVSYGGLNSCILRNKETGSVLPNCVGYAWGRAYELLGSKPKLSRGNAEKWYGYNDGYERGQKPKLGAIMCWEGKGKLAGHVAVVEKIYSDGSVISSNSNYSGTAFYLREFKPPYTISSNYEFQGFIYLPKEFEEESPSEYKLGIYKVLTDMYIRKTAGTNEHVLVKECTDKMKNALDSTDPNAYAVVKAGHNITALDIIYKDNGSIWVKNYSGYICLKGVSGTVYLEYVD